MGKIFFVLFYSLLSLWAVPSFAVDLSAHNFLEGLESFSSGNELKIVLHFKKPVKKFQDPKFFERSIQFTFDKAYIEPSKKNFSIGEELISSAQIYQYDQDRVRLRLVIGNQDVRYEERLTYERKDNRLVIIIAKSSGGPANRQVFNEDPELSAIDLDEELDEPVGTLPEKQSQDDLTPLDLEETPESTSSLDNRFEGGKDTASSPTGPTLLSSSLKVVTGLLIVLSLMLICYYFVKKYLLKEGSLLGMDKQVKVLSTSYIAPKKNITLLEVAGEILVLGVTASHISFLTKIENEEAIKKIKSKKESSLINWKKNKQTKPSFSKQLDLYTNRTDKKEKVEKSETKETSVKVLNRLIEEKINKLKTV